ncbi:MAG: glycoside hydrolase family 3 C-terminal domain-containing protein [Candidatus Bipolaricaulota bacterium]|nr:glycoside hydrolase family 3 C-terminal domain-containing protein [Candidatus Bipolaricaulota bacterium]MDW8126874.1 glycoside hydrolase family 3 N-terminal domain-containing protein [Candidatus Bipolaricaulota bacterium]
MRLAKILAFFLVFLTAAAAEQPLVQARHKPLLQVDGLLFRDLNANGQLDVYEDWRRPVEERVEDLLSRMTLAEKVAQMMHPTFIPRPDGSPPPFMEKWCRDLQIGFVLVRDLPSARAAAEAMNKLQEWCEQSRLGIPIVISMDSIHGLSYVNGGLVYPQNIGLAAIGDLALVRALVEASREEHLAVGVRMTLSPNADLATEPRWGRVYECPGEDPEFAAEFVRLYVEAYQNGQTLNKGSVIACVKHFPGAGPQMEGVDMAPIVSTSETLALHLLPFKAAIEAGVASVMPYYSIPMALDTMAALGSRKTLQDLLRQSLGFTGLITTDWGMQFGIRQAGMFWGQEISNDEALIIGIERAEVDAVGGASPRDITDVVRLVEEGKIRAARIDDAVRRILWAKFTLGIFENPYVDPAYAEKVVGCPEHQALSLAAARRSMTLVKNDGILPLKNVDSILIAGARAGDVDSITGGWTAKQNGLTIVEAVKALAGETCRVQYVAEDPEEAKTLAADSDVAIVVIGEPAYMHNPPWGASALELTSSQQKLLEAIHETGTPLVVVVLLARPYILTWCAENASAILIAYLPGTQGAQAIAETLFGLVNPQGKLPIQLPRNMDQIRNQRSDLPSDIVDPLYDRGFGLSYGR